MDAIWRLTVSDADGTPRFRQDMGSLLLDGSPVFEEEGNGNCRECTFRGQVGINPRDWVDVEYSTDGSTWVRRFSGVATQVRTGYNPDAGGYKLVGGMKKLEEAEVRTTLQPGNLKDQLQTLLTDLIASGQLGVAFNPEVSAPDLSPTLPGRGIVPNYQTAATVLKTIVAPQYAGSELAVTADRKLKLWQPTGTYVLDEINPNVTAEWSDVDAEELVTDVRFLFPSSVGGVVSYGPLERGTAPTVARSGQPASVLVSTGLPGTYGVSIKPLALSSTEGQHFTRLTANGDTAVDVVSSLVADGTPPTVTVTGEDTAFWDADRNTTVVLTPTGPGLLQLALTLPFSLTSLPIGVEFSAENVTCRRATLTHTAGRLTLEAPSGSGGFWLFPDEVKAFLAPMLGGSVTLTFLLDLVNGQAATLRAATLLTPNLTSLGGIAQSAGRAPAVQAGSITCPDWPEALPFVQITRRDKDRKVALGTSVLPAAIWRRSVTPAGELQTVISIGQRDTPEQSALATIIKGRDAAATITAVRAST